MSDSPKLDTALLMIKLFPHEIDRVRGVSHPFPISSSSFSKPGREVESDFLDLQNSLLLPRPRSDDPSGRAGSYRSTCYSSLYGRIWRCDLLGPDAKVGACPECSYGCRTCLVSIAPGRYLAPSQAEIPKYNTKLICQGRARSSLLQRRSSWINFILPMPQEAT